MKKMFRKKTNIGETGDPEKEELAEVQVESELPASELKQEDKEFESFFSEVLKKLPQKTSASVLSASSRIEQLTPINFEHFRSQTCSDDVSFGS